MRYIRRFIYNIKNTIKWIKFIWNNDYDWDWIYLLQIVIFKMKNMEKYFRESGHCVSSLPNSIELKRLITIGERLIEDNYEHIPYSTYDLLDNRTPIAFARCVETGIIITEREYRDLAHNSEMLHQKDIETFFNGLKQYRIWWD